MSALGRVRWTALIVAWVVDIVGSTLFGAAFLIWAAAVGRIDLDADSAALSAALTNEPDLFAASLVGGVSFSVLAGYVAARLARAHFLLHGLLSSAACLALYVVPGDSLATMPLWLVVFGPLLSPAAGVLGGYIRSLQVGRANAAVDEVRATR